MYCVLMMCTEREISPDFVFLKRSQENGITTSHSCPNQEACGKLNCMNLTHVFTPDLKDLGIDSLEVNFYIAEGWENKSLEQWLAQKQVNAAECHNFGIGSGCDESCPVYERGECENYHGPEQESEEKKVKKFPRVVEIETINKDALFRFVSSEETRLQVTGRGHRDGIEMVYFQQSHNGGPITTDSKSLEVFQSEVIPDNRRVAALGRRRDGRPSRVEEIYKPDRRKDLEDSVLPREAKPHK